MIVIIVVFFQYRSVGEIFLPPVLMSKLRANNEAGLYEKVWMKYIEKRLEILNIGLEKGKLITSFLEICKRNFRRSLFKKIPRNCGQFDFKNTDGIQMSVYGKVCGSSKVGKQLENKEHVRSCSTIDWLDLKIYCYSRLKLEAGKYQVYF